MTRAEKKEFDQLRNEVLDLKKKIDDHNIQRKELLNQRKSLRKKIEELEKKYA